MLDFSSPKRRLFAPQKMTLTMVTDSRDADQLRAILLRSLFDEAVASHIASNQNDALPSVQTTPSFVDSLDDDLDNKPTPASCINDKRSYSPCMFALLVGLLAMCNADFHCVDFHFHHRSSAAPHSVPPPPPPPPRSSTDTPQSNIVRDVPSLPSSSYTETRQPGLQAIEVYDFTMLHTLQAALVATQVELIHLTSTMLSRNGRQTSMSMASYAYDKRAELLLEARKLQKRIHKLTPRTCYIPTKHHAKKEYEAGQVFLMRKRLKAMVMAAIESVAARLPMVLAAVKVQRETAALHLLRMTTAMNQEVADVRAAISKPLRRSAALANILVREAFGRAGNLYDDIVFEGA